MRVLPIEDEPRVARFIAKGLREQSYAVDIASDGEAALYKIGIDDYDLVILDVMIPLRDGFEVCRELRREGVTTPVLMLTAREITANLLRSEIKVGPEGKFIDNENEEDEAKEKAAAKKPAQKSKKP